MRNRKLIALAAVLGMAGLGATSMVHAGDGCKGTNTKASMQSGSGCSSQASASKSSGCGSAQAIMTQTGSSCAGHAGMTKAGGAGTAMGKAGGCGSAKGASMECSMTSTDCEKMMRTHYQTHGWLGIEMTGADGSMMPTVTSVVAGSPAEKSGFKVGDVLTSLNGIAFEEKNAEALQGAMDKNFKVGETVRYTAKRDNQSLTLSPTLVSIPDASLRAMIATHIATSHQAQAKTS